MAVDWAALQGLTQAGLSPEQIISLGNEYAARQRLLGQGSPTVLFPELQGGSVGDMLRLAGGYGLVGPAVTGAGIAANYRLGRAGLARDLYNDRFNRQMSLAQQAARPYNTIAALEAYGQMGEPLPLAGKTLRTIRPSLADTPGPNLDDLLPAEVKLPAEVQAFAGGGEMRTKGPTLIMEPSGNGTWRLSGIAGEAGRERIEITPENAQQRGVKPYAEGGTVSANPYGEEIKGLSGRIGFSKGDARGKGNALAAYARTGGKGGGSAIDLAHRLRSGTRLGVGGRAMRTLRSIRAAQPKGGAQAIRRTQLAGNASAALGGEPSDAQSTAARLIGGALAPVRSLTLSGYRDTLNQGQIGGLGALSERDFRFMPYDVQQAVLDLLMSTGRVSDPNAIFDEWARVRPASIA